MPINLTDAEQAFADSPKGRHAIAKLRNEHGLRTRYMGANAPAWTADHEAEAVRTATTAHARRNLHIARDAIAAPADLSVARAAAETAKMLRNERLTNAWKGK